MKDKNPELALMVVLRLAVALWLAYLLILFAIDHLLYPVPLVPLKYYLINGVDALAVLGMALWPRGRKWLGQAFLPGIIALMSIVPILFSDITVLGLQPSPSNQPETMILRTLPVLLIALVLTAWQYRWQVVVFFSVGINLFGLVLLLVVHRPDTPLLPPATVLIIQTVSLLFVGYFISVLVTRLKQQQSDLEKANVRLVHYAGTLEELTISRERNRLSRELHDTLAHTLSALSVQLETAKAYEEVGDADAVKTLLDKSLSATRSGLQETRRALKALRASPIDDLGLSLAISRLAEEAAARANAKLALSLPGHMPALSPAVEQTLYRIAQEAMANAVHHANAETLSVSLTVSESETTLLVQDDGLGFDLQQAVDTGHYGLAGMQERAQLVGGQVTVTSHPGEGSTVQFTTKVKTR